MGDVERRSPRERFIELDSIRGIGISAVVWAHAGLFGLRGSFLFVDMFFVISGYLIATTFMMKYNSQANGKWPWIFCGKFLANRIRRIVPTLLIALLLTLIVGWFVLLPLDYVELVKSILYTAFLNGNLYGASLGNYFSISPSQAPLLHTWSLSLEEQFYLITPLILFPLFSMKRWIWLAVLGAACGLSIFTAGQFAAEHNNAAYFLFRTRIWEYLFGVIVAIISLDKKPLFSDNVNKILGYSSLFIFLLCAVLFTVEAPTPSYITVIPVAAVAMFIFARPSNKYADIVLKSSVFSYLGRCTYSIYLIHLPFMAFISYRGISFGEWHKLWLFVFSMCLGVAFSICVEQYRDSWKNIGFSKVSIISISLLIVIVIGCAAIISFNGVYSRLPMKAQLYASAINNVNPYRSKCMFDGKLTTAGYSCRFDFGFKKSVVLVGDSHSDAIAPSFISAMKNQGYNVVHLWFAGCPPLLNKISELGLFSKECTDFNEEAYSYISKSENVSAVFFMARWSWYFECKPFAKDTRHLRFKTPDWKCPSSVAPDGVETMSEYKNRMGAILKNSITELREKGLNVFVFEPVPEMLSNLAASLAKSTWYESAPPSTKIRYADYIAYNKWVLEFFASLENEKLISLIPTARAFCETSNDGECTGADGSKVYYYDSHHLNNVGAKRLIDWAFYRR